MYYRINEVKIKAGQPESAIPAAILKKLGKDGRGLKIDDWRIVKQSVDARDKGDILLVYSVDFSILPKERKLDLPQPKAVPYELPERVRSLEAARPVVCGFGPAGIYAALILAQAGYRPIVIERGGSMDDRVAAVEQFLSKGQLDTESNVQFGEGGAGTFSDGKLTTNIKDPRITKVLTEFVEAGAGEEILYLQKPHIGTDVLRNVVVNLRKKIESLGGEIRFNTRLEDIKESNSRLKSVTVSTGPDHSKTYEIQTDCLVLALGHSARDTFKMIYERGLNMQQKAFSIGLRIQHPQELINIAQYGKNYKELNLPPAEYKLSYHCKKTEAGGVNDGRGVYTFCMCPGGEVINSSCQEGGVVTNGMSYHARNGQFANSALLVDVRTSDFGSEHPLAGVEFQEKYERLAFENGGANYQMPTCTLEEMRSAFAMESAGKRPGGGDAGQRVLASLPKFAASAMMEALPVMGRRLRGFDGPDAQLFAVESRSSSPVRILRGEDYMASCQGVYPCGEGAGYAGGIVSAGVDGIRVAEAVIKAGALGD